MQIGRECSLTCCWLCGHGCRLLEFDWLLGRFCVCHRSRWFPWRLVRRPCELSPFVMARYSQLKMSFASLVVVACIDCCFPIPIYFSSKDFWFRRYFAVLNSHWCCSWKYFVNHCLFLCLFDFCRRIACWIHSFNGLRPRHHHFAKRYSHLLPVTNCLSPCWIITCTQTNFQTQLYLICQFLIVIVEEDMIKHSFQEREDDFRGQLRMVLFDLFLVWIRFVWPECCLYFPKKTYYTLYMMY